MKLWKNTAAAEDLKRKTFPLMHVFKKKIIIIIIKIKNWMKSAEKTVPRCFRREM